MPATAQPAAMAWSAPLDLVSGTEPVRGLCRHAVGAGLVATAGRAAAQLDHENGFTDGAPVLPTTFRYATWARVLGSEFATLTKQTDTDQPTLVDKYGATEPAEFFAVVTEYFFEKSLQLQQRHP